MGNGLIRQATKRDIFIVDKLGTSEDVLFKLRRRKLEKGKGKRI